MKHTRTIVSAMILYFLVAAGSEVSAERRTYESKQNIGTTVAGIIETLGASGLDFRVGRVYDRATDGKHGMMLYLMPGNTPCEITFHEDPKNQTRSLVGLRGFDRNAVEKLHRVFVENGLKEVGVTEDFDDSNPWPVKVR